MFVHLQSPPPRSRPVSSATAVCFLTAALLLCSAARAAGTAPGDASCAAQCRAVSALQHSLRPVDNASATPTVLITDGSNFDDLLTLLYLAKSPNLEPVAIFVAGNAWAHAAPSRRIMRDVLHLFNRYAHVPIFLGAYYALDDITQAARDAHPMAVVPRYRAPVPPAEPGRVACDDAFGAARLLPPAPPFTDVDAPTTDAASLTALAAALEPLRNGSAIALVTGTMTPLALLFEESGATVGTSTAHGAAAAVILSRLRGVVVMGGAFHVPGNLFSLPRNTKGEFNIYNDPHAAQRALKGLRARGVDVSIVPLDATRFAPITAQLCGTLQERPSTPEAQWAGHVLRGVKRVMDGIGRNVYDTVFL